MQLNIFDLLCTVLIAIAAQKFAIKTYKTLISTLVVFYWNGVVLWKDVLERRWRVYWVVTGQCPGYWWIYRTNNVQIYHQYMYIPFITSCIVIPFTLLWCYFTSLHPKSNSFFHSCNIKAFWHFIGLSPVWTLRWDLNRPVVVNCLPHIWHLNRFSPV